MRMTFELDLALWDRPLRIPDANCTVGGTRRYQRACGIPRYRAMAFLKVS